MLQTIPTPSKEDGALEAAMLNLIELNRDVPNARRDRLFLRLASQLCEHAAFRKAGVWPADSVAELIEMSARIERLCLNGTELN